MMIELTNNCNHKCIFCAHSEKKRKLRDITTDLLDRILQEGRTLGVEQCGFHSGSEPCLSKNFVQAIQLAKEYGYKYTYISTNGAACSQEKMRQALDAGLDSIKFSVNAGTKEDYQTIHGRDDFEKVINMINFVLEWRKHNNRSLKVFISTIRCSANKQNIHKLKEACANKVDEWAIIDAVWTGKMAKLPLSELKPNFFKNGICVEPFKRLTIAANGEVRACCNDVDGYLTIGSIHDSSLKEVWNSPLYKKLRRDMLKHDIHKNCLCHNCLNCVNNDLLNLNECYDAS